MELFDNAEPIGLEIQGRPLTCRVCGPGGFWKREAQCNTSAASFFEFARRTTSA
jgi:hypothetical protein